MRDKTKWIIGGTAIGACVVVAIVVPCVLLIPENESIPTPSPSPNDTRPTYTFDDLYNSSKFSYSSLYPIWDKEDEKNTKFITMNDAKAIVTRDVTKPDVDITTLINGEGDGKSTAYSVSADKKFVFYRNDYKKVWRHSYTANFAIFEIIDGNKAGTKKTISGFPTDGMIHHMEWSPTGHKLAYVHEWDVYVISNLEDAGPIIDRVTTDGNTEGTYPNRIYNGIPDWVYEEEMVSSNNVLYWAPDSSAFAFLKTDDTNTEIVEYSMYNSAQYPETIKIPYPKAGTTNPEVTLHVYRIEDKATKDLPPGFRSGTTDNKWPSNGNFTNYYFSRLTWFDGNALMATWIDRPQTESVGNKCVRDTTSGDWTCSWVVDSTEYVNNGWVGNFGPFNVVFESKSAHYTIYARPNEGDSSDGFWQIAKVDWSAKDGSKSWLTKTNYDIVGLNFFDSDNKLLYFTAAAPLPRQRHIFRVSVDKTDVTDPECMTCDLTKTYPNRCGWITPSFNTDKSIAVINCRGYDVPLTVYYSIGDDGNWGKEELLYSNAALQNTIAGIKWPIKEYGNFTSDKYTEKEFNYEIYKPADFDETKKYPLLIEVYAGPEFQSVTDVWTRGWASTHMVSDKNIIVASVDGRGSAYEGYKFMQEAYLQLGQKEKVDQTDFAKYLSNQPYIDETKVAIWGWSYGGYATSHVMGYDGGNTFKCGIAVAPLADWRFYDSMYAERYMGLPDVNADAYDKASIVLSNDLNNFKSVSYTLIHGTADDNVHFQNAAVMEKALVETDVDFDDFFYADEDHSIRIGPNANKHVYRQLTTRMSYCLGVCDNPYPGSC